MPSPPPCGTVGCGMWCAAGDEPSDASSHPSRPVRRPATCGWPVEVRREVTHLAGLSALALLLSSALLVAACLPAGTTVAVPARGDELRFAGSGAAYPAVRLLADAYAKTAPHVRVHFDESSTGSSGLRSLASGAVDVAVMGRAPTSEEARGTGTARYLVVGRDAVAVVVNSAVGVTDLTTAQLRGLYAGTFRTWRDLGGSGNAIVLLDRPEDETAKIALRLILGPDLVVHTSAVQLAKEPDMIRALEATAGAIGFFSSSTVIARPSIGRAVRIDGVAPDVAAIRAGTYRAVRTIAIATNTSTPPGATSALGGFLAFAASQEATTLLAHAGFAPPP